MKLYHCISTLLSVTLSFSTLADDTGLRVLERITSFKYKPDVTQANNLGTLFPMYPRVYRNLFHCTPNFRFASKVKDMGWVDSVYLRPLPIKDGNAEARFYSETDLLIITTGYQQGDCLEVVIKAEDGGDVYQDQKELVIYGTVDAAGLVHIIKPFQDYSLIINP
ncbi:hypothetical protein [Serratia fonticola]|uniref:hypothetical protein n=1 Tax=Serratia fonticola TaxID=47917 RepID=UPI000BA1DAA4|nr:hypothetical protein [Serratia fonticola]PAA99226.1 hypothetical protein CJJ13_01400 [Serratia fonticola]